jgi:hypothetical protein
MTIMITNNQSDFDSPPFRDPIAPQTPNGDSPTDDASAGNDIPVPESIVSETKRVAPSSKTTLAPPEW